MNRKYLFILCPPFCGSTLIYKIVHTSPNISTLIGNNNWVGEGQWLLEKNGLKDFEKNRNNPDFNFSMEQFKNIFDKYWDKNKNIHCDKSPSNIFRAKKIEDYFSKFGDVYFIMMMRNPYSCKSLKPDDWVKFAKFQKNNYKTLKNKILIFYEDLILNKNKIKKKIIDFIPELIDIDLNIGFLKELPTDNKSHTLFSMRDRIKPINSKYLRIIGKDRKNKILKNHIDLLNYFNYKFLD